MDFLLLGPVALGVHGQVFELESDKVRCLIAALALEANRPVAADRLMACMWDDDGVSDRTRLHPHVSRARKQIQKAWASAAHPERTSPHPGADAVAETVRDQTFPHIKPHAHTYTLQTDPATVDSHQFRRLCDDARTAVSRGDDERALKLLDAARKLWRGEPLAGLSGLWPAQVRAQLEAEWTSATAARVAASLRLGHFEPLIGELTELVQRDPLDEQFVGYLMLACYGSRRHSDVMRVFQGLRRELRIDSGNAPDASIRRLYDGMVQARSVDSLVQEFAPGGQRAGGTGGASSTKVAPAPAPEPVSASANENGAGVVGRDRGFIAGTEFRKGSGALVGGTVAQERSAQNAGDSDLTAADAAETAGELLPAAPPPHMLPRQAALEGRRLELQQIIDFVSTNIDQDSSARIVTITGMAGVGKTALAVHAAQRVSRRFPHGELYVNLRGHDGSQAPLRQETALGILLRSLGAKPESVPADVDECAAMLRTLLASRRCVIVLDDAESAEQVFPILPNDSASVVIITSRRILANLPDTYAMQLEALPPEDAITLFRRLGGAHRMRDTEEVGRITRILGYLPLAIQIAAMRFHGRKTWHLSTLGNSLERGKCLAELRDMETQEGIERAFSMSYRTLGSAERRAFRLLSLHPGDGFSAAAAAAILDVTFQEAGVLLEALLSSSLLQEVAPNRHRYHDLMAEFAFSLAKSEESEEHRNDAVTRLINFFITTADQANSLAYPHRLTPVLRHDIPARPLPFEATPAEARAWFETEREALLSVELYARTHGAAYRAAQLGECISAFLQAEWHWAELKEISNWSAEYWSRHDNRSALSRSLLSLSAAHTQAGEYPVAMTLVEKGLLLAHAIGDSEAEAHALRARGILQWWYKSDHRAALESYEAALSLRPSSEDTLKYGLYGNIGVAHLYLGQHDQARQSFSVAIHGLRTVGDTLTLARGLINEGNLRMRTRDPDLARESFEEALSIFESLGNVHDLAIVNINLADSLRATGEVRKAMSMYRKWLTVFQGFRDGRGEADTLNGIGFSYTQIGQPRDAITCHSQALAIAHRIGLVREKIIAVRGLGAAELALGDIDSATSHFQSAIEIADRKYPDEGAASWEMLADAHLAAARFREAAALLRWLVATVGSRSPREAHRLGLRAEQIENSSDFELKFDN